MSSIIHPLHKPLLCVKVEIDSIDHGFGIGNGLEGARLMRTAEIVYQRDIPFIPCPGRLTPPVSAVSPGASLCKNLTSLIEESDKHGLGIFQFHAGWYRRPKPPQSRMRKRGAMFLKASRLLLGFGIHFLTAFSSLRRTRRLRSQRFFRQRESLYLKRVRSVRVSQHRYSH